MKKPFFLTAAASSLLFIAGSAMAQGFAVNTTGAPANPSAMMDVVSTSKGLLMPRMNKVQRNAISSPANGLIIYQTDSTPGFYFYDGSHWTATSTSVSGWNITGNSGTNSGA
jgi:hypothetical protein